MSGSQKKIIIGGELYLARKGTRYLNLSGKKLTAIPDLRSFKNLRVLDISDNQIDSVPPTILHNMSLCKIDLSKTLIRKDELPFFLNLVQGLKIVLSEGKVMPSRGFPPVKRIDNELLKILPVKLKRRIKTLLLINRFRSKIWLPFEMIEIILLRVMKIYFRRKIYPFGNRLKSKHNGVGVNISCPICNNYLGELCIQCDAEKKCIDDEFCAIVRINCVNKHVFHKHCMDRWIELKGSHCPLCEYHIDIEKDVFVSK